MNKMTSGIGQYHTNEPDALKPTKKLTPYLDIEWGEICALVDNPQKVDKAQAQWLIPSSLKSRSFKAQEQNGQYYLLWVDLDKSPPSMIKLSEMLESFIGDTDYEIYSTRSAIECNQKARILIPLTEPLNGIEWTLAQQIINDKFESVGVIPDRANQGFAQVCYLPNKGVFYQKISKRDGVPS
jgi:hypothetical protein